MRKHKWLLISLISLILIQSCGMSVASATSSDDWTMFRHDLGHSGYTTSNNSTNSVKLLWNYTTHAAVWSSPAVANGCVFVGSKDGYIYCFNASNGELVWDFGPTGDAVDSSPAIDKGRVYVGSDDGWFYCLDIATGQPLWITLLGGKVRSCPVVVDGQVYIGSGKHDFFCLNGSDGSVIWSYPTLYPVVSPPAVSNGIVYVAADDYCVHALNASTGNELWYNHTGSIISSPSVYNGCVYIGTYEGYVFCLNASTGSIMWTYRTGDTVASSPAVAYGCVYVGSEDNSVYCLNASSGEKIWQTPTGYWVWSSPAVADGNVYVGSEDYNIYCLNASTGAVKWSYTTGNYVDSSPAVVNDTLYIGSHDHLLYAFALRNSTGEPLTSKPNSLRWTTIAFDAIACTVGAVIIFAIIRFVQSTWRTKRKPESTDLPDKNIPWFRKHTDAICVLAILAFSVIFFVNLGTEFLWAADEQTYSQMAVYMVKSGDFLTPSAFGELAIWAGKPPLLMWLMSLSYQSFGVNNFAARLWIPVFGTLSLVLVFFLGKKFYNRQVGFLSAIVLGTFTTFYAFARHAMTDVPLIFFMVASMYFLLLSENTKNTYRYAALSGLFFGLALMTKQIGALLIPLIAIIYLAATKRSIRFLITKRFAVFLGAALLILAPWLVYMNLRFGYNFWNCYFMYSVFTRTVSPIEGHVGNYLYYFNYLATSENLLWVILLPFAVGLCAYNSAIKRSKGDNLILTWMAIVLIVFTIAQTKIYYYILPAYPAFAIAISSFVYQLSKKIKFHNLPSPKTQKAAEKVSSQKSLSK